MGGTCGIMPESGADLSQLILRHIAAHSFWSPTRRGVKSCKSCKANLRTNLTGTRPITVGHRLQTCKSCCERAFGLFHAERLPMHGGAPIFRENGSVPLFPHLDCMARLLRHLNKPTPKSREFLILPLSRRKLLRAFKLQFPTTSSISFPAAKPSSAPRGRW